MIMQKSLEDLVKNISMYFCNLILENLTVWVGFITVLVMPCLTLDCFCRFIPSISTLSIAMKKMW